MSDFTAGFASRHDAAARALHQAFSSNDDSGFAPADLKRLAGAAEQRGSGPVSFSPQPVGPRHFKPADPGGDHPTKGWDPLDPAVQTSEQNFVDPIVQAREQGYAEGVAAASMDVLRASERDAALVAGLADALGANARIDRVQLAAQLRQAVLMLVTKLVGDIGVAPELLTRRIEAATALLADSAESALLRMHPDDVALVDGKLGPTVFAIADAGIERGGFALESASTVIEDGPALWLEQLAHAIEHVAEPTVD